ncbi:MAG: ABC transporter, partial [Bdellovibrionales bacterium]|nr:ABC transporter [Massilia sp.]
MTSLQLISHPTATPAAISIPGAWQSEVEKELAPGENVLSAVEVDLDARLRFKKGILVVTSHRLIAREPGDSAWKQWSYRPGLALAHHDHAGVGHLELKDEHGRLANWRFTLGQNLHAIRVLDSFREQLDSHLSGRPVHVAEQNVCPSCKAPLEPDQDECPICTKVLYTPPSTWTLFRLWQFAKPYRGQLALGFFLMLASTAAHMIPPYLTMPLMDNVLIPFQNGKAVDQQLVWMYMLGLLGAAVLAYLLGWWKTYVLALVSERMGADLRSATYEHLMKLSLEFFGGKRTGDLMSRIGSGSDRICVFLSLHLLDFASGVLMFFMTGGILCSINPTLAAITLVPLPFIAYMIHIVRDRLRTGFEKIDRVWGEVTNVLADTIPGIRVVKAFAQEKRGASRFREANRHNLAVN